MNTTMDEVFGEFLANIDDYSLSLTNRDKTELLEELFGYYKFARRRFRKCRKDLGTNYDSFYDLPDGEEMVINSELDWEEIDIIVTLMLVGYIRPIINSNKVMRQALTDKDFNLTSQANHMSQLSLWYRELRAESDRAITAYTYDEGMG